MRLVVVRFLVAVFIGSSTLEARADWQPRDITPATAALQPILTANATVASGTDPRFAQRRERWTYTTGTRHLAVSVAIRDADFRTSLELDGLTYMAGRKAGVHWRGDGNGIVHGVEADLQGDALDRPPQAVFPIDPAICSLAGEARLPAAAWVIQTHPVGDKPVFFYIDETTKAIVREVMRDGKRVVTTTFDRFESFDGALRARHWHIDDGNRADALDVTIDAIEPATVNAADIGFPERRVFAPPAPLAQSVTLPTIFHDNRIQIHVDIDGKPEWFDLDTGTTSITVNPDIGRRYGGATLEHAILPRMSVGPLRLERVSVLTVPYWRRGLLGYDFFFGHVVEIDYLHERVRVLSATDAETVFADPATTILEANIDQGMPLVHAAFGAAQSDTFALDTGSPHLYVMDPFVAAFDAEIAAHWTRDGRPFLQQYLEGGIELQPYRVAQFAFANAAARDILVGAQIPTKRTDDLAIPFGGIIGTDILQNFDMYVDYDNSRLGFRR